MVRAVPGIRRAPHEFLAAVAARHGGTAALPLPRTPVLVLTDPHGVRRVLVDNARGYGKGTVQYRALAGVTGPGLLASDGGTWRRHRRVAQPAFHHGSLDAVAAHAVDAARRLVAEVDALPPGRPLEVLGATSRTSLEVVGHTLAAADLSGVAERLVETVGAALEVVVARAASPVPGRWPTPARRRLRRLVAEIDEVCARIVAQRRAAGRLDDPAAPPEDLVGLMLAAGMDEREVRDELVTFVVAGHETVASSLTWTLDLLARHPHVQQRLHAELAGVLGAPGAAREPGWDDLRRLPYTRAVVDESLRLYPPAWVVTRQALADDVVAGVAVPAGTLVVISTWALHRHPDVWARPEEFRPERFLDGTRREVGYVPFGAGPRLCIGRDLALVEEVLVLATLLRGHVVRPAPGPRPAVEALVSLRPRGGLPLLVERLAGSPA